LISQIYVVLAAAREHDTWDDELHVAHARSSGCVPRETLSTGGRDAGYFGVSCQCAHALGKQIQRLLDVFMDLLFSVWNPEARPQLSRLLLLQCARTGRLSGPAIFRARLEDTSGRFMMEPCVNAPCYRVRRMPFAVGPRVYWFRRHEVQ
jgi:hypothetical protein